MGACQSSTIVKKMQMSRLPAGRRSGMKIFMNSTRFVVFLGVTFMGVGGISLAEPSTARLENRLKLFTGSKPDREGMLTDE